MSQENSAEFERLLARAARGDEQASARVAEAVHADLRTLAHAVLRRRSPGQTLCTTALVNESWMRLLGERDAPYADRSHFLRAAAAAMRSILIDYARRRRAAKRGGRWDRSPLDKIVDSIEVNRVDLIALDDALTRLQELSPRRCRVVELRFFAGLSIADTARVLGVSHGTVENDWGFARVWLHREITGEPA